MKKTLFTLIALACTLGLAADVYACGGRRRRPPPRPPAAPPVPEMTKTGDADDPNAEDSDTTPRFPELADLGLDENGEPIENEAKLCGLPMCGTVTSHPDDDYCVYHMEPEELSGDGTPASELPEPARRPQLRIL